jgi:hypothetical protein
VFPAVSSFLFTFKNLNLVTLLSLQIVMLVLPSIGPINHNANHICTSCLSHFSTSDRTKQSEFIAGSESASNFTQYYVTNVWILQNETPYTCTAHKY